MFANYFMDIYPYLPAIWGCIDVDFPHDLNNESNKNHEIYNEEVSLKD
jgi:hypothetical protein